MLYSGVRGKWGLKGEAIFSPVFTVTDKTSFIFAVRFRFGIHQPLSRLCPFVKLEHLDPLSPIVTPLARRYGLWNTDEEKALLVFLKEQEAMSFGCLGTDGM